ncbi:hypothetical protein A2Z23_02285 [Candidatus Curtissbacteria bacterium RBG_16_39_7]|uniref:Prolipoprotein diacylglyceryl transferase n=1 Tax=Candidatus Curtissbacteria bacterium RBG_16_39_7 TaxID=1797707 RepID=A0A1F5G2X3_9BACT|nr:MAG: hypothetical protein A2Z23_02285 [Candidatus Curtissbacteria bacterium RBG_16_39_7]
MFPVLFSIGSFTFYTFNLFLIVGLFAALYFVWQKAREEAEEEEKILDIALLATICGLLGGRIVEGILSWKAFGLDFYKLLAFWAYPGFSAWGALGVSAAVLFLIYRRRLLAFAKILDYLSYGLAVFLPFGFLGHIFAGSYFGSQTQFFWGVSIPGLLGKRHPTAIIGFLVSLIILSAVAKFNSKKHFTGATTLAFLSLFSLLIFVLEWLRGDSLYLERKIENLIFSAIVLIASLSLFYLKSKRNIRKDLGLAPKALSIIYTSFVLRAAKFKNLILKRRNKSWRIPETHYKI